MVYQTIKPTNETVAKTFAEDTNEQLEAIIVRADKAHKDEWRLTPLADRQKIVKKAETLMRTGRY
jgi:succinate-semialdehyde dehydrogenase/glutarate-semialdehyde dehydrogenase